MADQPAFSEDSHRTFAAAQAEAASFRHEYVGTEHLLLALVRERQGLATTVLEKLGVELEAIPATIAAVIPRGSDTAGGTSYRPFTTRAKRALELAHAAATRFGHPSVRSEHLLLGLLEEAGGPAAQVLGQMGVSVDAARRELLTLSASAP